MACEYYHEQLWDYLYDLLKQTEVQTLRAHVDACPSCRAALAEAESQQQLLARAARVIHDVPEYALPGLDLEVTPAQPQVAMPPAAATLPLPAAPQRRSRWRRSWPVWAAAAAVLVSALGLREAYQRGLASHEAEVAQARTEVDAVDARFVSLRDSVANETQTAARHALEKIPPQLQVLASARLRPEAPTNLRVTARDQTGQLRDAEVTTSLRKLDGKVLYEQTDQIAGEGNIQVPGLKIDAAAAQLVVKAQVDKRDAKIVETLAVAEPAHASHLALNKSTYYIGEMLFFRSLTLDRYSLKPPVKALPLRFALIDADGRTVKELPGQTGPGGVSGGELALTSDLVNGNYTLQVSAAGMQATILPQSRGLEIVRDEVPQFEFDRNQYRAGDRMALNFRAGQQGQGGFNPYANKAVNITVNADGQPVPQAPHKGAAPIQGRLDNAGTISNIQLQLPPRIASGAEVVAEIVTKDGKNNKKIVQQIPVVPSERTIDFFPEGGDLVAGVPNRVYYRVRSPQGESVPPEGHVIVLASKAVIHDSLPQQGLGEFTFTPDAKEAYAVRLTGPDNVTEIHNPFHKLGIKTDGVVLHALQPVSTAGQPLTLVLRNQGSERRLLLQTTCRGQIVDHQYVDLPVGSRDVTMQPSTSGMLRLTAYDAGGAQLIPVAERLLFRIPAKRLDVTCQIANGPGPFPTGSSIALKLNALDEKKQAGPAWLLAAVVDDKYRAEKSERSLDTHFYLGGDFGAEELDNANLAVKDTPAARQALDRFLGTQGWRRFVRGETGALLALRENLLGNLAKDNPGRAPDFFSLENSSTKDLQDQYQAVLQRQVNEVIDRANVERASLIEQKENRQLLLDEARLALARFQERPLESLRLAGGILVVALLLAGSLLLTLGLLRSVRKGGTRPTSCFAGATLCLFACLVLYALAGNMASDEVARTTRVDRLVEATTWPEFQAAKVTQPAASTARVASPPLGYFVASAAPTTQEEQKSTATRGQAQSTAVEQKRSENQFARSQNLAVNQAQNPSQTDGMRQLQESLQNNEELRRRFLMAASQNKTPANPTPQPTTTSPGGVAAKKAEADALKPTTDYFREYAHRVPQRQARLDYQDTLLWHPTLFSADGSAQVSFDLSQNLTTYRILIYANSPSGRLGFYEGHLEVRPK